MSESSPSYVRWFRWGCLTLVVMVCIPVACTGVLVGTALWKGSHEAVESRLLSQDVPTPTGPPTAPGTVPNGAGHVVLDFTVGEFFVEAGNPGEPIRVEAEYDRNSYELTRSYTTADDGSWTFLVRFREIGLFRDSGLRVVFGGAYPRIHVFLPPDVPLTLHGSFARGGADLELGGLWLTAVELEQEKGGCDIDFDEPLVAPLDRFVVRARQGGFSVSRLGHASPRLVEIDHRMGGMGVDLRGRWLNDADVSISSLMGGADVRLPDDVRVEWVEGSRFATAPTAEPGRELPTLRMSVRGRMGGLQVR